MKSAKISFREYRQLPVVTRTDEGNPDINAEKPGDDTTITQRQKSHRVSPWHLPVELQGRAQEQRTRQELRGPSLMQELQYPHYVHREKYIQSSRRSNGPAIEYLHVMRSTS